MVYLSLAASKNTAWSLSSAPTMDVWRDWLSSRIPMVIGLRSSMLTPCPTRTWKLHSFSWQRLLPVFSYFYVCIFLKKIKVELCKQNCYCLLPLLLLFVLGAQMAWLLRFSFINRSGNRLTAKRELPQLIGRNVSLTDWRFSHANYYLQGLVRWNDQSDHSGQPRRPNWPRDHKAPVLPLSTYIHMWCDVMWPGVNRDQTCLSVCLSIARGQPFHLGCLN